MAQRIWPINIYPVDADGNVLPAGTYILQVVEDGVVETLQASAPVIPLPTGSDASDVPAGTPVESIILVKA